MLPHQLHTPKYHSVLKWALLASFILFALYFWKEYSSYQDYLIDSSAERTSYRARLIYLFFNLSFWGLVGLGMGKLKEGLIAFVVALVAVLIPSYYIDYNSGMRSIFLVLKFVPAVVFGMLVFKDERKWQSLWLILILSGASLVNSAYEILDTFARLFRHTPLKSIFTYKIYATEAMDSYREFYILRTLLQAMRLFVAIAAASWFMDRLQRGVRPIFRSLDLGVNYSKLSSTAVFMITKWLVILGGLSIGMIATQRGYLQNTNWLTDIHFAFQGLENILGLFAVAAFLRCFLAEYVLSKGYKVDWHFFWLMVPIVGEFVWLFCLMSDYQINDLNQRIAQHKKAVVEYPEGLRVFLYIMVGLSIGIAVFQVNRYGAEAMVATLIMGVIAFLMMVIYFHSDKTIYWILGITFLSFLVTLFFKEELSNIKSGFGDRLSSIANAIIFMVIFHLKAFKVYPVVEAANDKLLMDELKEG